MKRFIGYYHDAGTISLDDLAISYAEQEGLGISLPDNTALLPDRDGGAGRIYMDTDAHILVQNWAQYQNWGGYTGNQEDYNALVPVCYWVRPDGTTLQLVNDDAYGNLSWTETLTIEEVAEHAD